jgi:hypothetical protein
VSLSSRVCLIMSALCIECGKRLEKQESEIGFCADCNARIENDIHILRESEDDSFAFLAETAF